MQSLDAVVETQKPRTDTPTRFSPWGMFALVAAVNAAIVSYHLAGVYWFDSPLTFKEQMGFGGMLAFAIVGIYQFYFWVQKNDRFVQRRSLRTKLDDLIPYAPQWVWVYGILYYFMIGFVIATLESIVQGVIMVFGGLVLMSAQVVCFLAFPVSTPVEYRQFPVESLAGRYLRFMQSFDGRSNCFPSAHCSVSMYVSLLLLPHMGWTALLFAAGIAISSLLCKQQLLADVPVGLFLGWVSWLFTITYLL